MFGRRKTTMTATVTAQSVFTVERESRDEAVQASLASVAEAGWEVAAKVWVDPAPSHLDDELVGPPQWRASVLAEKEFQS